MDLGRTSALKLLDQARPERPPPGVWVEALTGFHAGYAAMPAPTGEFVISGCEGADVFLLDDAFQGVSAKVFTEQSVIGPLVRVLVDGPGFKLGQQALAQDRLSAPVRLPTDLHAPGVVVRLSPVEGQLAFTAAPVALPTPLAPDFQPRSKAPDRLRIGLAVVLAGLIVTGGWLADRHLSKPAVGSMAVTTTALSLPAVAEENDTPVPADPIPLEERIAGTDLAEHLTVRVLADGTERIDGELPPGLMPLWRDVHAAHDAATDRATIVRVRALPDLSGFPAIATIRHGDAPKVYFASGRTAAPGDVVEGWTLEAIAKGELVLMRAGERRTLTY